MIPTPGRTVRMWNDEISPFETEKVVEAIQAFMADDPEKLITLELFSGGGNCQAGFALCDWIAINKVPLQTVGFGQVSSMAIPIFLMGKHRVLSVNCVMVLHPMQRNIKDGSFDVPGLNAAVVDLRDTSKQYADHVTRYVKGLSTEQVIKMMNKLTTLTAKKAKKLGFAHEVLG